MPSRESHCFSRAALHLLQKKHSPLESVVRLHTWASKIKRKMNSLPESTGFQDIHRIPEKSKQERRISAVFSWEQQNLNQRSSGLVLSFIALYHCTFQIDFGEPPRTVECRRGLKSMLLLHCFSKSKSGSGSKSFFPPIEER